MPMHVSQDFVARTQRLASQFINASDELASLAAEYQHRTGTEVNELAGGASLDLSANPVLAAQLQAFYATLGALLSPLSAEQKSAIYALKA